MKNILLHLMLLKGVMGVHLAYVVRQYVKVAFISPRYYAYLNLNNK